jgi:hypothetical protein
LHPGSVGGIQYCSTCFLNCLSRVANDRQVKKQSYHRLPGSFRVSTEISLTPWLTTGHSQVRDSYFTIPKKFLLLPTLESRSNSGPDLNKKGKNKIL